MGTCQSIRVENCFSANDFFCLKRPKRGCHTRDMLAKLFAMNNYYFDTSRVGQLDTSEIFATKGSWKGRRSYAPKDLETRMVGGGGMWVGPTPKPTIY